MRKLHLFVGVAIIGFFIRSMHLELQNETLSHDKKSNPQHIGRMPLKQELRHAAAPPLLRRVPAQISQRIKKQNRTAIFEKQERPGFEDQIETDDSVRDLPRDYQVAKNIRAMRKENFSPRLGELVTSSNTMAFFKPSSPTDELANVVYDSRNKVFYPLSSVLKIKQVDEELRQNFKQRQLQETYYHKELKLLFVQTLNSNLLTTYQELKAQGFQVELEIQRSFNKGR